MPAPAVPVRLEAEGDVGVIVVDNPPVNATSNAVRAGLRDAIRRLAADDSLAAGVVIGAGTTFVAGADIREFGQPATDPDLPTIIAELEACPKPVVAAMHGAALGGGYEIALACDARIALADAVVGLPEITLGIIPGAGGTQRLPRLIGIPAALDLIVSGRRVPAAEALALGLVDRIVASPLRAAAIAFARGMPRRKRPLSALQVPESSPEELAASIGKHTRNAHGRDSVLSAIAAVRSAATVPFAEALAAERATFQRLRQSEEAAALRHLFFAERAARKVPDTEGIAPAAIISVGVAGAGTMGAGIAAAFAAAGFAVTLADTAPDALARAEKTVDAALADLKQPDAKVLFAASLDALAGHDLIVEAVFEDMLVKREVLGRLAALADPATLIASNTSYLDIDALAGATGAPERFLGLHFFAPAHRMRLLEIVRGARTSPQTLATGLEIARRLGKVPVVARVGDGFVSNRIFSRYRAQAEFMLEEGALPWEIDAAAESLGFAMGPFAVGDLSGLDIAWRNRQRLAPTRDPRARYVAIPDKVCELGRLGRKTNAGWYDYPDPKARGVPSPAIAELIATSRPADHRGKPPDAATIRLRLLGGLVNEAAHVVAEGIAARASDIDVTFVNGYGFSRFRGGPLFRAARFPAADLAGAIDLAGTATGFGFRRADIAALLAAL